MSHTVKIQQHTNSITTETGQTILDAALAAGVPYPHGCRSGNCGACKSRLKSGNISLAPYSEYALTEEEKAGGLVLACRAIPWDNVEVSWINEGEIATHPRRKMTCQVINITPKTHDISSVELEIVAGGPFVYSAGQYSIVTFENQPAREYSMATMATDPFIEFHVRRVSGGKVSNFVLDSLSSGDTVLVEGPFGNSWLRELHGGPIITLAGGSGIAPIKAIIEKALALGLKKEIRLYFGVREDRDLYLVKHFVSLTKIHPNFCFIPVLSEPGVKTKRRTGLLHNVIKEDYAVLTGSKVYLAGPPAMIEAATKTVEKLGVTQEDIHADAFYTEAEKMTRENA
tara:strand:+ start:990 stop:2015 length:1026 start_codon:yes stop_codon:yes gene_type:complete